MIWLRGLSSIEATDLYKFMHGKWSYSSSFQAFVCPTESTYRLVKTNLLVPEDTAKSWVDPSLDDRVISVMRKNDDRQTNGFI